MPKVAIVRRGPAAAAVLSLALAAPLSIALNLAPFLTQSQRALADDRKIDCSDKRYAALCEEVARECAANPRLCPAAKPALGAPTPNAPSATAQSGAERGSAWPTVPLDPPNVSLPAQREALDAAAAAALANISKANWAVAGGVLAVGETGRMSPSRAEYSMRLISPNEHSVVAGELVYRIYQPELDAMMYGDMVFNFAGAQKRPDAAGHMAGWHVTAERAPNPLVCMGVVQPADAPGWTPFELQLVAPSELVKGARDWVRCIARSGSTVVVATVVEPHREAASPGVAEATIHEAANAAAVGAMQ